MTCRSPLGALPAGFSSQHADGFPYVVRNGLFWVADAQREALRRQVGTTTLFYPAALESGGKTTYAVLFGGTPPSNWVEEAVQAGKAVAIRPAHFAVPAIDAFVTSEPYDLAWDTAPTFGGRYVVLAAPDQIVQQAAQHAAAGLKLTAGKPPKPKALDWKVPVLIGTAALSALAFIKAYFPSR